MKKCVRCLTVLGMMLLLLCGCGKKADSLTVYVVQSEALYTTAVNAFKTEYPDENLQVTYFDSYEEIETQLKTELMTGKGPDVLLFNCYNNTEDIYKLCVGNSLLALDDYVEELSAEEYFETILDAGIVDGHQYLIPLSWNLMQAYAPQSTVEEKGYTDLFTAIPAEMEALSAEDNYAAAALSLGRADLLQLFMETFGDRLIDTQTGELALDQEAMRETAEYVKAFYDELDKMRSISTKYKNDFAGAVSHFTFMVEDYSFMNNLRYYQTTYPSFVAEDMQVMFFEQHNGEGLAAQVVQYGAVNANTRNAKGAWNLLRYLLDASANMNYNKYETESTYYTPVNKAVYEACVSELTSQSAPGPVRLAPLNEEYGQFLTELPSRITVSVIPNASLSALVQECMEPYLSGTDSFDSCYETLTQRLKLYLDE